MKPTLAALALLGTASAMAADPVYDRQLIVDAGRAYIEARLRNTEAKPVTFDWKNPTIKAVSKLEGRNHGYAAVFFPQVGSNVVAFAYFAEKVENDPLQWFVIRFGTDVGEEAAIAAFDRRVRNGWLASGIDE